LFTFEATYASLPERFYARVRPAKATRPRVLKVNRALAELLGVDPDALGSQAGAELLAGNVVPEGATPIALAYAGHQFGGFVPQLGDGRALLLGEIVGRDGKRRDVQLKGSGPTPFSRNGDGRAALGPVLREYVVSEAMAALGVPTTRALAAVLTGDAVVRDQVLPGAVLTRVAASHIRVGTFEYFAAREDVEALRLLTEHALLRHYPGSAGTGNDALALLGCVIDAHAELVARWLGVGFVHGVMNTDNTSIAGETLDYGPCAFLDDYDPTRWFSSIDRAGRYAFSAQPGIALWNLARLAESLLPLLSESEDEAVRLATTRLDGFRPRFEAAHGRLMRAKLGLTLEDAGDAALAGDLLARLAEQHVDYTLFFRRLCDAVADASSAEDLAGMFEEPSAFYAWAEAWRGRLRADGDLSPEARGTAMRRANPAFIPRNHRVEEALDAAVSRGDFGPFDALVDALSRPYDDQPAFAFLAEPPPPGRPPYRTFCGT